MPRVPHRRWYGQFGLGGNVVKGGQWTLFFMCLVLWPICGNDQSKGVAYSNGLGQCVAAWYAQFGLSALEKNGEWCFLWTAICGNDQRRGVSATLPGPHIAAWHGPFGLNGIEKKGAKLT